MAVEKVKAFFEDTGLKVIELPESSAMVQLAAEALGRGGIHLRALGKRRHFHAGNTKNIGFYVFHDVIDAVDEAAMIPPDKVEEYIGHAPGGVCPFAVNPGVKVYLDESLKRHEVVYPAAGSSNSAVKMTIAELEKYSGFEDWVDVTKALE